MTSTLATKAAGKRIPNVPMALLWTLQMKKTRLKVLGSKVERPGATWRASF